MTHNLPEKDDAPWLDTQYDGFMTHEEIVELAAQREKENQVLEIAKNCMNEHSGAFEQLAAIEAKELIDEALEELNAIVMGGQDTREFYNSVKFIKDVLNRLRDT
jgi:hypothetical protein